jgi:hypothetical protein
MDLTALPWTAKLSVSKKAEPWVRRLVTGISPRNPGFDPRSGHVTVVMEKVALGQVPLPALPSSTADQHSTNAQ